jgi:hypothetical protein
LTPHSAERYTATTIGFEPTEDFRQPLETRAVSPISARGRPQTE